MAEQDDKPKGDRQLEILIHKVAHKNRNVKGIAAVMGMPESTLQERLNYNNGKGFFARDLPGLIEAAEDDRIIDYLCSIRRKVAVDLPKATGATQREWLRHIAAVTREAGEAVTTLADAVADGRITDGERDRCLREIMEAIRALLALKVELESQ